MKKIIRVLFFAFALVLFTGTVNAKEEAQTINASITFAEIDSDGNKFNSGNYVQTSYSNTLVVNNDGWSKFSKAIKNKEVTKGGKIYTIDGWYDEEGNAVPESMYYDNDPYRIKVSIKPTTTGDVNLVYYLKWTKHNAPVVDFKYINVINNNNGTGRWTNSNGTFESYTHTFKAPVGTDDYQFLYWLIGEDQYTDGDEFTILSEGMAYDEVKEITAYAWWQPAVYLNLYSDNKIISEQKDFEKVSIDTTPTKYGYKFLGWYDAEGNKVEDTTFYAAEKGTDPEVRTYNLYAKWERIMVDVNVSVVWDDNNNEDGVRPESVEVELKDGEEVVETVTLSEENQWTHTFNVPKYGEESEIEYTVSQNEVEYYVTTTTGSVEEGFVLNNFHEVWPKGQGGDDFEVVQTGNEVNYSLLLIGLFVELLFVKRKLFN